VKVWSNQKKHWKTHLISALFEHRNDPDSEQLRRNDDVFSRLSPSTTVLGESSCLRKSFCHHGGRHRCFGADAALKNCGLRIQDPQQKQKIQGKRVNENESLKSNGEKKSAAGCKCKHGDETKKNYHPTPQLYFSLRSAHIVPEFRDCLHQIPNPHVKNRRPS